MSELSCEETRSIAAELALGLVSGTERADALAHLATCSACSDEVELFATVADRLLLLAPLAEPSAGFETVVLARVSEGSGVLGRAPARRSPSRLSIGVAAAVSIVALLLVSGLLLARDDTGERVAAAPMATASGQVVGDVYVHDGSPGWIFVTLLGWEAWTGAGGQTYVLEAKLRDGRTVSLGELALDSGRGGWGTNLAVAPGDVRAVSVVDGDGRVRCSATLRA